jgi:hypothetical protein
MLMGHSFIGKPHRESYDTFSSKVCIDLIAVLTTSTAVGSGFEPQSGQPKDYKIGICCFSHKHVALRRKSKESESG